jgi:hypothetical protein
MASDKKAADRLAAAKKRRAEVQAEFNAERDNQLATDLEAITELEIELGDSRVSAVDLPYNPGLPLKAAVRRPDKAEIKRYRKQTEPRKDGKPPDFTAAHEMIGEACCVYPDPEKQPELFEALCEALPALKGQLGIVAIQMSVGVEEDAKKD